MRLAPRPADRVVAAVVEEAASAAAADVVEIAAVVAVAAVVVADAAIAGNPQNCETNYAAGRPMRRPAADRLRSRIRSGRAFRARIFFRPSAYSRRRLCYLFAPCK